MNKKKHFSIAEFARYARVTRQTLLFYDRIGLISPISRGENNYRYYSAEQLTVVNVIRTLQELGMTLDEIKSVRDQRTPHLIQELFSLQIEKIDEKIDQWVRARKLLNVLTGIIHHADSVDETAIAVQRLPSGAIILGGLNDYSGERTAYDALFDFYNDINIKYPELDMNYPAWGVFSEERIKRHDWKQPDRYFFFNPDGFDRRPAALYAIGYTRGGYGQSDDLYKRLINYIDNNGYEISGPAYEEYPLNEICIRDEDNYLMRVMITVRKLSEV